MPRRKKKTPYDATLRFRAFQKLAERIERIVDARGYGDASDVMREGTALHVKEEEERLGLPPIEGNGVLPKKRVRYAKGKKK